MRQRSHVGVLVLATVTVLVMWPARRASAQERVEQARKARSADIAALFKKAGVAFPPEEIFLRAIKDEDVLELWAGRRGEPLVHVRDYEVCMASGGPGPKRMQGDLQVPEGFYVIDRFNPWSNFHLSLGINYPNDSDRIRGVKGRLGGDIFIHGSCVSIGCLALRDGPIEELYLIALAARDAGQKRISVHLFPARLDPAGLKRLEADAGPDAPLVGFWKELQPGFAAFEESRRPPRVSVLEDGRYRVKSGARAQR